MNKPTNPLDAFQCELANAPMELALRIIRAAVSRGMHVGARPDVEAKGRWRILVVGAGCGPLVIRCSERFQQVLESRKATGLDPEQLN